MKIVHIINYFQPQLGYQETFLAKEQIRRGHDVSVVTSDRYYPFVNYDNSYRNLLGKRICGSGQSIEEGIPVFRLPSIWEVKYRVWLQGLEATILKVQPDFVIVHALLANAFRLMRLRKCGLNFKLVVDEHLIDLVRKQNVVACVYNSFKRTRLKKRIRFVDKFVGVTRETCRILNTDFGIPVNKIEYIPLGADTELFKFDHGQRHNIRKRYGLQNDDILLLYTGKIVDSKGVRTLVEAFGRIQNSKNVFLLMLGTGKEQYCSRLLDMLGSSKRSRVFFTDFIPNKELVPFYNAADICVWGDTISVSMLEAMSCSRPIVGCNIPAFLERIEYNNGLSYEKGSASDLSQNLEKLIQNQELRLNMGKKGRKVVEDKFSWCRISEQFLTV